MEVQRYKVTARRSAQKTELWVDQKLDAQGGQEGKQWAFGDKGSPKQIKRKERLEYNPLPAPHPTSITTLSTFNPLPSHRFLDASSLKPYHDVVLLCVLDGQNKMNLENKHAHPSTKSSSVYPRWSLVTGRVKVLQVPCEEFHFCGVSSTSRSKNLLVSNSFVCGWRQRDSPCDSSFAWTIHSLPLANQDTHSSKIKSFMVVIVIPILFHAMGGENETSNE